jgi:hypothetical protein
MKTSCRAALLLLLVPAAGCSLLHHKTKAAPEAPPSAGIEADFRDRWIDKRVHELMTATPPMAEADAHKAAEAEFAKQYPYLRTVNGQTAP